MNTTNAFYAMQRAYQWAMDDANAWAKVLSLSKDDALTALLHIQLAKAQKIAGRKYRAMKRIEHWMHMNTN